jgi:lipopolysaccharide export system protein LptA
MKKSIFLILIASGSWAAAQTNAPAAKVALRAPTQINSDAADFDLNTHQAIYRGHVRVEHPELKLTCGTLLVDLPTAGAHLSNVVADADVVIDFNDGKGQSYHVTAAKAVYAYKIENAVTNETVTFTGSPKVETAQSTIESEPMIWDRAHNKFTFIAPKMISREAPGNSTNGLPVKLF